MIEYARLRHDIVEVIKEYGGSLKPTELLFIMINRGYDKYQVQIAMQTCFDRGVVVLGRNMTIDLPDEY